MARDPRQNTPHAVVVLPTYNERENIAQVLEALLLQAHRFPQAKLANLHPTLANGVPAGCFTIAKPVVSLFPLFPVAHAKF